MNKYLHYFKIQLLKYFEYRVNATLELFRIGISIGIMLLVWLSVYQKGISITNYPNIESLIVYYLLIPIFGVFTGSRIAVKLESYIAEGSLSTFQLKPASIKLLLFFEDFAVSIFYFFFYLLIFLLIVLIIPSLREFIGFKITNLPILALSFIFALTLNYLIYMILGSLTFWTTSTHGIVIVFKNATNILTGTLFPLTFFPNSIKQIIDLTPFPYMTYFPINIFMGKVNTSEVVMSFITEIIWIIVLLLLLNLIWKKGLIKYEANGN